jgi:hypothetical protein
MSFDTFGFLMSSKYAEQAFAERLDRNDMLAVGQNDAGQRDAPLVLHGVAYHRECVDAGLAVGRDVIGAVDKALVDLVHRDKAVDIDGMGAFDLDGFQLLLVDLDVFALLQLITAALLFALDHIAGLGVNHLLLQAVAGLLVDHVEVGLFDRCRGRIKRHRARDQGKLQRPFPISARGHYNLRLDGFGRIRELQLPLGVLVPGACRTR